MLIHLVVLFSAQTGQMTILMRGPRAPSRTFAGARPRNELPRRASNKPERRGRAPAPLAGKNLLAAFASFGSPVAILDVSGCESEAPVLFRTDLCSGMQDTDW